MKRIALIALLALSVAGLAHAASAPKSYYIYFLKLVRKDAAKTGFTDAEKVILAEHVAYHQKMTSDGVELLAGPTLEDDPIGICIFSAASPEEAQAVVNADPTVAKGVMTATLHPIKLAFGTAVPQAAKQSSTH